MSSPNPCGYIALYWPYRHHAAFRPHLHHYIALAQQARGKRRPCRHCGMVRNEAALCS